MTTAILSLIFILAMVMITKIPIALAMNRQPGGYDNRYPRDQQSRLEGFGKRAVGAHQNALEAFPMFAASVLAALIANPAEAQIPLICTLFVLARIGYTICYWADLHMLRSTAWTVGFGCCLWLLGISL